MVTVNKKPPFPEHSYWHAQDENNKKNQLETEKNLRNQREKLEKKTTILTKVGADTEKPYNRQRKTRRINKQTNKNRVECW